MVLLDSLLHKVLLDLLLPFEFLPLFYLNMERLVELSDVVIGHLVDGLRHQGVNFVTERGFVFFLEIGILVAFIA